MAQEQSTLEQLSAAKRDQAKELLARVQDGDQTALRALEKARQEILGKPGQIEGQPITTETIEQEEILQGPFGTKSPEYTAQLTADSTGETYKEILNRALQILQGDAKFEPTDAYDVVETLMNTRESSE